jgi:uncharacterized protein (DUF1697 family)
MLLENNLYPDDIRVRAEARSLVAAGYAVRVIAPRGRGEPAREVVEKLESTYFEPERVVVSGREVYAWHPGGMQRSKLARALSDARLGVTATARNWNTVKKLHETARA